MEYRVELAVEVATKVKKIYRGDKLTFSGEPRLIKGIGSIEIFAIIAVDSMQIPKQWLGKIFKSLLINFAL